MKALEIEDILESVAAQEYSSLWDPRPSKVDLEPTKTRARMLVHRSIEIVFSEIKKAGYKIVPESDA